MAPGVRFDRFDDRAAHRVTDDGQHGHLFPIDHLENRVGLHLAVRVQDRAAAAEHRAPRRPVPAHVHERAEGIGDEGVGHRDTHLGQRRQAGVDGS